MGMEEGFHQNPKRVIREGENDPLRQVLRFEVIAFSEEVSDIYVYVF